MANHKSALKRIRQTEKRKLRNRYQAKTMRHAIKKFSELKDKKEATQTYPGIVAMIDKLAKNNIIHKNKAANIKSKLNKQLNAM